MQVAPFSLRTVALATTASVLLLSAACGGRGATEELLTPDDIRGGAAEGGGAVAGYNPPHEYERQIGVRAAAQENTLLVSVHNRRDEPIIVGPDMFRIITPDGLYAFERGRDDLSGFGIRELAPGEGDVFIVRVPRHMELGGLAVVMNYPPAEVIQRVFIEPVVEGAIQYELPPPRESRR